MTSEQEYYQDLAKSRAEDRINTLSEKRDSNKQEAGNSDSHGKSNFNKKDVLSPKKLKDDVKAAALAFTAIDLEKDAVHFGVIMISLIADLITLIPFVGSFLAIPFSILIWILYAISGHLEKRIGRKAVVTATSQALELLGGSVFVVLGMLPFYTIASILNFWIAVAERKAQQIKSGK